MVTYESLIFYVAQKSEIATTYDIIKQFVQQLIMYLTIRRF
jgi:hypothetical protein